MAAEKPRKKKVKRDLIVAVLIVLVLYAGVHVISRTEGVRSTVADKISNNIGQPVALKSCGATPLLGLRLEDLNFYGVQMPEVRIQLNWFSWIKKDKPLIRQIDIQGLVVDLKQDPATGRWEPFVLHGLAKKIGAVLGLSASQMPAANNPRQFLANVMNDKTLLQLSRAKVVWSDANDRDLVYLSDADLSLKSGMFIDRNVIQVLFNSGSIQLASGKLLSDFRLEAFRIEDSDVVTILNMADSDGTYEEFATKTFWKDLGIHLNSLSEL